MEWDVRLEVRNLFDLNKIIARALFDGKRYPWQALEEIRAFILSLGPTLSEDAFERVGRDIWIARDATVAPTACLNGPLIVDRGAEIRHCAYIRESAVVGKGAVVGNSTELKNCILFDNAQVPHFNYVGDSILGERAHLGAGAVTSNVRSDQRNVTVHGSVEIPTGRFKLGAMVGDRAEVGCGSVLNPGAVLGRDCIVYPTSCVRGVVPEGHILKASGERVRRVNRDEE